MSSEIERHKGQIERTWNDKAIRTSKAELSQALAPIFATFPGLEMSAETFNAYYMMLCDLDPKKLAGAVMRACQAHEYPTHLVTVAAIRKAYDGEQRAPGPSSEVDLSTRKDVPANFFRLPDDEDRKQRMERLRMTKGWGRFYS